MSTSPDASKPSRRPLCPCRRDLAVLRSVAASGVASFDFLRKTALKDCTEKHARLLLRKLVYQGCLSDSRCDCGNTLGWRLNLASKYARQFVGQGHSSAAIAPHYRTSFRHDQVLNEIEELFLRSPAVKGWIKERELKRERMKGSYRLSAKEHREKRLAVPDGVILLRHENQDLKIAFELELTQKSSFRIRKKLECYITERNIDFSFFVIAGEGLRSRIIAIYRDVVRSSNQVKFSTRKNGIYFAELAEIRERGLRATFVGLKNSITLADFQ